jgi:tetratricopeptide (TPR) repeat protein
LTRDETCQQLAVLVSDYPDNDAVVVNFAALARWRREASILRGVLPQVEKNITPIQRAFLNHRVAVLEGDNEAAGIAAEEWFSLESNNPMAAAAALVAVGIGQSRWAEAAIIADYALAHFPDDRTIANNAAYILAMDGRGDEAIRVLGPIANEKYVYRATLGLAYLASGDIEQGMRLYREAAEMAEQDDPPSLSLMTAYQALVVHQLGMDKAQPAKMIEACALVPVELPDDWQEKPDYLRLRGICAAKGYEWPLSL